MELKEVKILLQRYFDGESSPEEEKALTEYFSSDKVADELRQYIRFFGGIAELTQNSTNTAIEDNIMDYIIKQEKINKERNIGLWRVVTGIAASIIILFGSLLIYEAQKKPFEDTFKNPDQAYLYAVKTLQYVSEEYNAGLAQIAIAGKFNQTFDQLYHVGLVLNKAQEPLAESLNSIRKGMDITENLQKQNQLTKNE